MEENTQVATKTSQTAHTYVEVGNDLLAKPDALAGILLVKDLPTTLIFCNSPSEADMVDVMLRKKGVTTSKLIGNVPYQKVVQEIQRAHNKEICAIVITDVAAREVDVKGFELVVNYGIPEDPEIYLHRATGYEQAESLQEILSLVSPLDFGNFHYLKKVAGLQFSKVELPPADALAGVKSKVLFKKASEGEHLTDPEVQALLSGIMESADRDKIVSLLIYNTIKVLPRIQEESATRNSDSRGSRGDRWNRGSRDNYSADNYEQQDSQEDTDQRGRRERGPRESGRTARERYNSEPVQRDARLYLGLGLDNGIDANKLTEIIQAAGYDASTIKRSTLRDSYSFIDVADEIADEFIEKVKACSWPTEDLIIKKATYINAARVNREDNMDDQASTGEDLGANQTGELEEEAVA